MLLNVPKILSPELIKTLCEMGHGDEIVIADANFPSENFGQRCVRADGISGEKLLEAILSVIPPDTYSDENMILMELVPSDVGKINPEIWDRYSKIALKKSGDIRIGHVERFAFYERAKNAYAVVASGEEAVYANVIIKKGVIK